MKERMRIPLAEIEARRAQLREQQAAELEQLWRELKDRTPSFVSREVAQSIAHALERHGGKS
jgi:hypothetical protein